MSRTQLLIACWLVVSYQSVDAQSTPIDTPAARLRPIGSPSAIDRYRTNPNPNRLVPTQLRETVYQVTGPQGGSNSPYPVRQAAMQQFEAPSLPPGGAVNGGAVNGGAMGDFSMPNNGQPGAANVINPAFGTPATGMSNPGMSNPGMSNPGMSNPGISNPGISNPGMAVPPNAMTPPAGVASPGFGASPTTAGTLAPVPRDPRSITSSGDLTPIAPPQIGGGFATIDNCNCVSPPSGYMAASATPGCAPVSYQGPVSYVSSTTVPGAPGYAPQIAGPAVIPAVYEPGRGVPKGPLISFGQDRNPVQVGQGILGQPVAYVPGQRFRNWIRYLFP